MGTEWGHFVEKAGAEAETVKECPVVNATEEWVWRSEKERECWKEKLKGYPQVRESHQRFSVVKIA